MDSFMFRVSIAAGEFPMEEPQGQDRSSTGAPSIFWSFPMSWSGTFTLKQS